MRASRGAAAGQPVPWCPLLFVSDSFPLLLSAALSFANTYVYNTGYFRSVYQLQASPVIITFLCWNPFLRAAQGGRWRASSHSSASSLCCGNPAETPPPSISLCCRLTAVTPLRATSLCSSTLLLPHKQLLLARSSQTLHTPPVGGNTLYLSSCIFAAKSCHPNAAFSVCKLHTRSLSQSPRALHVCTRSGRRQQQASSRAAQHKQAETKRAQDTCKPPANDTHYKKRHLHCITGIAIKCR
jgi:hypothetical protein